MHFLRVIDALKRVFIFPKFFPQNSKAIRELSDFINKWSKNGLNKNKNLSRIHKVAINRYTLCMCVFHIYRAYNKQGTKFQK
jgi:hypothetical protein